jgi:hypothetical protein
MDRHLLNLRLQAIRIRYNGATGSGVGSLDLNHRMLRTMRRFSRTSSNKV